jgi:hypothetical protein
VYAISAWTELANDDFRANDTTRSSQTLGADVTLPSGRVFDTYPKLTTTDGWQRRQGNGGREVYNGFTLSQFSDGTNSVLANSMSAFTANTNVWLVRHGLKNGDATPKSVGLTLAAGTTVFGGGINTVPALGNDDSLNVRISTDCGGSWRLLRAFTQSDFGAARISNRYAKFIIPITGVTSNQTFSIAIQMTSGGTAAPNTYSWLVDNVRFPSPVDAATDSVAVGQGGVFAGCVLGAQERVGVQVVNQGSGTVTSVNVGYKVNSTLVPARAFTVALPPGADTILYFTGTSGANLSTTGTYVFKGFVSITGDPARDNDTITRTIVLGGSSLATIPTDRTFITLPNLITGGFGRYSGVAPGLRAVTSNVFNTGFPAVWGETITATVSTATSPTTTDWLLRPQYALTGTPLGMQFTMLVSANTFGADPIANIGDDTLSIVASNDCGATWRTLRRFSQTDVASGAINNAMRTYTVNIPFTTGALVIGYRFTSNGTAAPADYRWQFDNVRFLFGTDSKSDSVLVGRSTIFNGCPLSSQQEIGVRVTNNGFNAVSSVQAGYIVNGRLVGPLTFNFNPALAPGRDTVLFFTGTDGANMSTLGTYVLKGFAKLAGDASLTNDTARRTYVVGGNLTAINTFATLETLLQMTNAGFRRFSGRTSLGPVTTNVFTSGFPPVWDETICATISTQTPAVTNDWFVRPSYQLPGSEVTLQFSMLVSRANSGALGIRNIGDDTLSVVASNDCGLTWRTLRRFSQADVASGALDSNMRTFNLPIPFSSGSLVVGWRYTSNNTSAPNPYRWQFDSVRFRAGIDIRALSAQGIPTATTTCNSSTPITVQYDNSGFSAIDTLFVSYTVTGTNPVRPPVTVTREISGRLIPGASGQYTFNLPLVFPGAGTYSTVVEVSTRRDNVATNNTLNFTTTVRGSGPLPPGQYANYASLVASGFTTGSGPGGSVPTGGFVASTSYGGPRPTASATINTGVTGYQEAWLISPTYAGQSAQVNLRANISVAAGLTGTNAGAAIGTDDSLSIYVRRNCGNWELVQAFTGADYTSGVLSNALQLKVIALTSVTPADSFQVAIKASNGGTAPSAAYRWHLNFIYITDATAVRSSLEDLGFSLYPNPTTGQAYLTGIRSQATVRVQDLQGRILRTTVAHEATSAVDLTGLAKGTYFIRVETQDGIALERLIVE